MRVAPCFRFDNKWLDPPGIEPSSMIGSRLLRDKVVLYHCFDTLFRSGIQIAQCFTALALQVESPGLKAALARVQQSILRGQSLSRSMQSEAPWFSDMEIRCLAAGERGGFLHVALAGLAEYFEEQQRLRRQLASDLAYPLAVVAASLLLVLFLPPFLQNSLTPMLSQQGNSLPWMTGLLVGVSAWLGSPWLWLGLSLALALTWKWWQGLPSLRQDRWLRGVPGLGSLLGQLACIRCLDTLRLALRAGLTVLEALQLGGSASGSPVFQEQVRQARRQVELGEPLCTALRECQVVPAWLAGFLEAGEHSGRLESLVGRSSLMLKEDWRQRCQTFLNLLQPLLLGGMGLLVGFLAVATLLPMSKILESL